jgi:hypothetical protein
MRYAVLSKIESALHDSNPKNFLAPLSFAGFALIFKEL